MHFLLFYENTKFDIERQRKDISEPFWNISDAPGRRKRSPSVPALSLSTLSSPWHPRSPCEVDSSAQRTPSHVAGLLSRLESGHPPTWTTLPSLRTTFLVSPPKSHLSQCLGPGTVGHSGFTPHGFVIRVAFCIGRGDKPGGCQARGEGGAI